MSWISARGGVFINLDLIADLQVQPLVTPTPPDKTHEMLATRADAVAYRVIIGTQADCEARLDNLKARLRDARDDQPPRSPYVETTKP